MSEMGMTRKPDEIKKGLECCSSTANCADGCPYHVIVEGSFGCDEMGCEDGLLPDALALIQQLQDDNAQLNRCIENMTDKLNAMNDEVAKLQAERDALMHWAKGRCDTCAHKYDCVKHDPDPEGYVMHWYDDCDIWEWRGVQKEE